LFKGFQAYFSVENMNYFKNVVINLLIGDMDREK